MVGKICITWCLAISAGVFGQNVRNVKDTLPFSIREFQITDCFDKSQFTGKVVIDTILPNEVMSSQRVWRVISLQDAGNKAALVGTHGCEQVDLFEIIKFGLLELNRNAFASDNFLDVAKTKIHKAALEKCLRFKDSSNVVSFDREGNETSEIVVINRYYTGNDVISFLLKEDWYQSSKTGEMMKYIVGLAPLVYDQKLEKVVPLFWIYFPEWKEVFSKFNTINSYDNFSQSYLQMFNRRKFFSQIVKLSNLQDRSVRAVSRGEAIFQEADRIKENLSNKTVGYYED